MAMASVKISRKHWVTKFESGICGTGRMMKIWKQRVIDNYPRRGASNETTAHILRCPCESVNPIWDKALQDLDSWVTKEKICPDLRKLLIHTLSRCIYGLEVTNLTLLQFDWLENVFESQKMIS